MRVPLRLWIPAALAGIAAAITLAAFAYDWHRSRRIAETFAIERSATLAKVVLPSLEPPLSDADAALASLQLRRVGDVQIAAHVIGADGRILFSSYPQLATQSIGDTRLSNAAAIIASARTTHVRQHALSANATTLLCAFPFRFGRDASAPLETAVLLVESDLTSLRATERAGLVRRTVAMSGAAVVLAALAWWFFRRTFAKRLEDLVNALGTYTATRHGLPLPADGGDELARISAAVNHMAAELAHETGKVREREALLSTLTEHARVGMAMVTTEHRYVFANAMYAEVLGLRSPDVLGRRASDVLGDVYTTEEKGYLSRGFAGERVTYERKLPPDPAAGGDRWVSVAINPAVATSHGPCVIAVLVDITMRKRAEDALRASETRFREVAEKVEDVFWISAGLGKGVLYVSPAYEKIWGRSCRSLIESPGSWSNTVHPEDRERVRRSMREQVEGRYDVQYRLIRPDGELRWIRDRAFPVRDAHGDVVRIVGVAKDITKEVELEAQLRHAQKMEAIGLLAGGIAHDFNNILTAILIRCDLPMDGTLPPDAREALREIRESADRAAALTRQLLLFSRRQVMQPRDLDLNELVTQLTRMLRRMIGEDIHLELALHDAPLPIRADSAMLDQVLLNLAVNARDAMPSGGTLTVETGERRVDAATAALHPGTVAGRYATVRVRDTGCGIPSDALPRIFDPFFTTKPLGKGTGLGLATAFGIVQQHGGWIEVESSVGGGSTFTLLLPAMQVPTPPVTHAPRISTQRGSETVLLVEDEPTVRLAMEMLLTNHGYRVIAAGDGASAVKSWEEHRDAIALLITDLVMPGGMNGHEVASRLLSDRPDLRVIYVSGYSATLAGKELELCPGENFLQKPFPMHDLLAVIRRALDAAPR